MTLESLGPYRIVSKIGAGGMGEVFLADDPRLGRRVAIKRCGGGVPVTPDGRERLRREARAAAALSHPHIAAVYDVLETPDGPHVVMEFVEGETLASVLRRGPLPIARAVRLGIELSDALAAAHAAGVIHRDLKPGNVMITPDGHVKVLDFGLAKLPPGTSRDSEPLTSPGVWLGTPGYTAPEQLLGHGVDSRGDIYSLGALLYESIVGRPPFEGDALAVATAIATSDPPRLAAINPSIPPELDDVIHRALARDPSERPQQAADVRRDLESLVVRMSDAPTGASPTVRTSRARRLALASLVIVAAVIVTMVGYRAWSVGRTRTMTPAAGARTPVVAVLPFENLSATGDAHIASGFQDSLIIDLSGLPQLTVLSRAALREAKTPDEPVKAARLVGANYVVDGTVQQSGDQFRVNLQILDADGKAAWSSGYKGSRDAIFDLQRQVAEGVIDGLRVTVSDQDRTRIARPHAASVTAASAYWRGRDLLDRDVPESTTGAISAFQEAIAADNRFAAAHAALAEAFWTRYVQTKDPAWAARALDAADRALQIDPEQSQAWVSRAQVHHGTGRSDEALADLDHALALNPRSDDALRLKGRVLGDAGRRQEAVAAIQQAIALRPEYWGNYDTLGRAYYQMARWTEAIDAWKKVIALQPDSPRGYVNIGVTYQRLGDNDQALSYFRRSVERAPTADGYSAMGNIEYARGDYGAAAESFRHAVELSPRRAMLHRNLGDTWRRLGDPQKARAAYQQAVSLSREDLGVNPQDAVTRARLAVYLAKLGSVTEARREITRAIETATNNSEVRYRAAVVEALLGRVDPALDQLEKAVSLGYSGAAARQDDDLAALRGKQRFNELTAGAPRK